MYNIHNHYDNIYAIAKDIVAYPRLLYLHPFGSTGIENVESLGHDGIPDVASVHLLFCYDQEPILPQYNYELFEHIQNNFRGHKILLNTEHSPEKDKIVQDFGFADCYYFYHAFAAADWYRGYQYNRDFVPVKERQLLTKFITFNRLTSHARVYRSMFVSKLQEHDLLRYGHVSYSETCPDSNMHYSDALMAEQERRNIQDVDKIIHHLNQIQHPLRIDVRDQHIPNGSMIIGAIHETQTSFLQVVTETCFWDRKLHLTEKIFKPIICKQPFLLLGCAYNLQYLKEYGFKTFSDFWSEDYDSIPDPHARLNAVVETLDKICQMPIAELKDMLVAMEDILEYNYNHFYSKTFLDQAWNELETNLTQAIKSTL